MRNIVYRVIIKKGQAQVFKKLAEATLMPEATNMPGCTRFSLFQNTADTHEFMFYETWDNEQSVHEYKEKLISILGKPRPGEEFPEAMNNLIAEDEDLV
jgi:quinol monooxygenase YgiN